MSLHYEMPVITVMPGHKEQSDFVGLQQTLSQLGFDSGSALLKLSWKDTSTPLEEAMAQITQYFKTEGSASSGAHGAHAATSAQAGSVPNLDTAAPEATTTVAGETITNDDPYPELMDVDGRPLTQPSPSPELPVSEQNNASTDALNTSPAAALAAATSTASEAPQTGAATSLPAEPAQSTNKQRAIQVFAPSTSSTPQAARNNFNEADYQPTIEHAKIHQNQLQARTRNQRLLSDKELEDQERARQEKLAAETIKVHTLRIRLPDGTLLQQLITKEDTAAVLYTHVASLLDRPNEPFDLKYTGPTGRLVLIPRDSKRLIQDLRFSTNELLTFQWSENASPEVRASRRTLALAWAKLAKELEVRDPYKEEESGMDKGPVETAKEGKGKGKALSMEERESKLKSILGKAFKKK